MMKGPYFYETKTVWQGQRRGAAEAGDLPAISVGAPPEFGGETGHWSPEHLLAAAVESCLMTTFLAIAEKSRLKLVSYRSSSLATLDWIDGRLRVTKLTIRPLIELDNDKDKERAARLLEKAEQHCPISNALNAPLQVEPAIVTSEGLTHARTGGGAALMIAGLSLSSFLGGD